ncbi:MAG TPA: hypothetical protein VGP07_01035 [Polyangia bacterium]
MTRPLVISVALAAAVTIGGSSVGAGPVPPPATSAPDPSVPPRAAIDWETMSRAERKDYMKTVVLPKAQAMFTAFDPKQFKHVTCGTCHGEDYARGTYKMPSADLPMLPASSRGFKELRERSPEIVTFMSTQVKPTMAALLGKPEFSPTNAQGFACFNCHMKGHERPVHVPPEP